MASARYRQRGKKKLWLVEIRQGDKTLNSKSGFRTKKDGSLRKGKEIFARFHAFGVLQKR